MTRPKDRMYIEKTDKCRTYRREDWIKRKIKRNYERNSMKEDELKTILIICRKNNAKMDERKKLEKRRI
jgi:hypothetical protein